MKQNNKKLFDKYKDNLTTAYRADYSRNLPNYVVEQLAAAYEDETGYHISVNTSCGHCVLDLLKRCAKIYFKEDE